MRVISQHFTSLRRSEATFLWLFTNALPLLLLCVWFHVRRYIVTQTHGDCGSETTILRTT